MRPPSLLLLPLLLALAAATYVCPPDKCVPPKCVCASTKPPLSPAPQFIVLTNDDAATVMTVPAVLLMLDNAGVNRNGCPLPATWYISIQYTQPEYVQMIYMKGHEIATHTLTHQGLPNATEIVGAKRWLNETANVPLGKIRGFRGPYLLHDPQQRAILQANGFLYDSTITSSWGPGSFSPDGASNIWPFTMDYGIPINCEVGTGPCSVMERHPGLWEVPIWNMQNDDGTVVASMDPAVDNITDLYMRQLMRSYKGNRAPVGVFLHAARLLGSQEVADQYAAFFQYALSMPDVWVVTVSELLRWMADPVPASAYSLACPTPTDMTFPGGRFCLPPTSGCVQGTWHADHCACTCLNTGDPKLPGFCPDAATGACTVLKTYNLATLTWGCPGVEVQEGAMPSPASGRAGSGATGPSPSPSPSTASASPGMQPQTSQSASSPGVGGSSLGTTPSASASPTTSSPSSSPDGVADVQPLGGAQFALFVRGEVATFAAKAQAVCNALAWLAAEAPASCTIATVTEASAPIGAATRRLASTGYLLVVAVIKPAAHTEAEVSTALSAAMQDGRLAAALASLGVQLASVEVASAAPSTSKTVAAAVGGAVGGAVLVFISLGVFFVVRSWRAIGRSGGRLPVSTISQDEALLTAKHKSSPPAKGLHLTATAAPSRLGEAPVSAYSSTPRGAASRHHSQAGPFGTAEASAV